MTTTVAEVKGADVALNLVRRAQACQTLEDLQCLLVNDLALLLPADRTAMLVRHGNGFRLAAISDQVEVNQRSGFVRSLPTALVGLPGKKEICVAAVKGKGRGIPGPTLARLKTLMQGEEIGVMIYLPLVHQDVTVGCLLFFHGRTAPPESHELQPVAVIGPPLAAALERELVLRHSPGARRTRERLRGERPARMSLRRWLLLPVIIVLLLLVPVPFKVGGRAQLAPRRFHICYSELAAPLAEVLVKEGEQVQKGQVLARLDDRNLAYTLRRAKREHQRLETEIQILRNVSAAEPDKAWELELAILRCDLALETEQYLKDSRRKLDLTAPVTGLVVTPKLQSLTGRRFKAGEAFCRIAPTEQLEVVVGVSEADAGYLRKNMPMEVMFAATPDQPVLMKVENISPLAEPVPGRGNEIAVSAAYRSPASLLKPGMGGVGHITVGKKPLGFILFRRIWQRLRVLALNF